MNIKIFRDYALSVESVRRCKILLENEFSIIFEERESLYHGVYFKSTFLNSVIKLSENYYDKEDYWIAPDYKNLNAIISIEIFKGKKIERIATDEIICEKLRSLNFILVKTNIYEEK